MSETAQGCTAVPGFIVIPRPYQCARLILIFIKKLTTSTFYSALWRVENRMRRQLRQQLYAAAGGIFSIKSVDFLLKNSIKHCILRVHF